MKRGTAYHCIRCGTPTPLKCCELCQVRELDALIALKRGEPRHPDVCQLTYRSPDGIPPADAQWLNDRSERVFVRYELHRRTHDTPTAFRLAVDDASGGQRLEPKP
jgi:hypothetical protein